MFNYEDYLLQQLNEAKASLGLDDYTIRVYSERVFKLPSKPNGSLIAFVIKNLNGSYVYNVKTQPIQIICYTEINTMAHAMQILDLFAKQHNSTSMYNEDDELIKQDYGTVITLRPMIATEIGFKASLYCFGTYIVSEKLKDIKNLTYNNEVVNFTNAGIGYTAVVNTAKISGQEISKSLKQEAGVVLSLTLINDNSTLVKNANSIMLGGASGNTKFTFTFELNDTSYTQDFIITSATFSTDKENAPTIQITFSRA